MAATHQRLTTAYLYMLLAIDPGLDVGWALFLDTGRLLACGLGDPRIHELHKASEIRDVIIEHPFVYPRGQTKDPNAIVKLAIGAGEWAGTYRQWAQIEYVLPWQWKGSVPKVIHHERLLAILSTDELEVFKKGTKTYTKMHVSASSVKDGYAPAPRKMPASKKHNVLDAIGLGLFFLGRAVR